MFDAERLIDLFERMNREHWGYKWGGHEEGLVDCAGAFQWALSQLGVKMAERSSNYIARRMVGEMRPASEARPGWAVFRRREANGDTPSRWLDGRGDFYHVGLMGRNGRVLNAQSEATGFVESPLRNWSFAAPLKAADYETKGGENMFGNATVSVTSGHLNLREGASTRGKVIGSLENGQRVNVIRDEGNGWVFCKTESGEAGYAAKDYLLEDDAAREQDGADETDAADASAGTTTLTDGNGVYIMLVGKWTVADD